MAISEPWAASEDSMKKVAVILLPNEREWEGRSREGMSQSVGSDNPRNFELGVCSCSEHEQKRDKSKRQTDAPKISHYHYSFLCFCLFPTIQSFTPFLLGSRITITNDLVVTCEVECGMQDLIFGSIELWTVALSSKYSVLCSVYALHYAVVARDIEALRV